MKTNKPAKTTFAQRGSRLVLPIIGHAIREIRLRSHALPILVFQDAQGNVSDIEFEAVNIRLLRGATEQALAWNAGKPYTAKDLLPFLELLASTVVDAVAEKTGTLHLESSNGFVLTATPDVYEGWHFRGSGLFLHGDDGRLIF